MFMIIQQQTCELHLFHIKEHTLSNISGTILRDHHYWGHSFLVFQGLYQYKVTSAVCACTLYTLLLFFLFDNDTLHKTKSTTRFLSSVQIKEVG